MSKVNKNPTKGPKKSDKKNTKIKKKTKEYCSINSIILEKEAGNNAKSILEPSSGGTGIRLKIPKARLIITIVESINPKS